MAFGGRELRLILSIQSYGTTNISRLRQDIMRLSSAVDAANAKQIAQAKVAQRAIRVSAAEQELRNVKAGLPAYVARNKAVNAYNKANASVFATQTQQLGVERQLFDLDTRRIQVDRRLTRQLEAEGGPDPEKVELYERQLKSISMQEGILGRNTEALTKRLADQEGIVREADQAYKNLVRDKTATTREIQKARAVWQGEKAALDQATAAVDRHNLAQRALPIQDFRFFLS
jgi:hypothetical protein